MTAWNGVPANPERDSSGHVLRVDGRIDIFRWNATNQWFEDNKGRWVAIADCLKDGDEYLGLLLQPAEITAIRAACDTWYKNFCVLTAAITDRTRIVTIDEIKQLHERAEKAEAEAKEAREKALREARYSVEVVMEQLTNVDEMCGVEHALDAIRALMEEKPDGPR